jgi:archaellum component FlaC
MPVTIESDLKEFLERFERRLDNIEQKIDNRQKDVNEIKVSITRLESKIERVEETLGRDIAFPFELCTRVGARQCPLAST